MLTHEERITAESQIRWIKSNLAGIAQGTPYAHGLALTIRAWEALLATDGNKVEPVVDRYAGKRECIVLPYKLPQLRRGM